MALQQLLLVANVLIGSALSLPSDSIHMMQRNVGYYRYMHPVPWLLNPWLPAGSGTCTPGTKLSHAVALAMCQAAGIGIYSGTGRIGCRDPGCTSLEQVRCDTVLGILGFQRASGCPGLVITGGTEQGHAPGQYSHYNGYKLDIRLTDCITGYIQANFRYTRTRDDGAKVYVDGRGNEYALESNYWDILYTR